MPRPVPSLHALNAQLVEAVGGDPAADAGFRLTVLGGFLPVLERFELPCPAEDSPAPSECIVHRRVVVPSPDIEADSRFPVNVLNVALCEAVGVSPDNAGFRLTVLGGELPALEVFVPPPAVRGALSDEWAVNLEGATRLCRIVAASSEEALRAADELDADPVSDDLTEPIPERHDRVVAEPSPEAAETASPHQ